MIERKCVLCGGSPTGDNADLCEACMVMERRLDFLIVNHREAAIKFLGQKFNEANDVLSRRYDRRKTPYQPPPGTHTPDRRKRIRRVVHIEGHGHRRKSDR